MTDSSALDRVAQAIHQASHSAIPWRHLASHSQSAYREMAQAAIDALELTEQWGVQISYEGQVISDNPLDKETAEAVVRRNVTGNAHLAVRFIGSWRTVGDA